MITFTIAVKEGPHTRGEILELEDFSDEELARVDALIMDLRDHLERVVRRQIRVRERKAAGQ